MKSERERGRVKEGRGRVRGRVIEDRETEEERKTERLSFKY